MKMNWQERAEKAEAELAKLREQKPVAWMHNKDGRVDTCHDSVKELWIKVGQKQNTQFMREIVPCRVEHYNIPLYARPVPERGEGKLAVAAGLPAIGPYRDSIPAPAVPATCAGVLGANDQIATLMRFYQVSDIPSLAIAQAEHVERLQAKLPAMRDNMPRNPRGA